MKIPTRFSLSLMLFFTVVQAFGQREETFSGFELSIDQDRFADFLRDEPFEDNNHVIALRLGFYGSMADEDFLILPFARRTIDWYVVDKFMDYLGILEENTSHNLVLTINGFTPAFISDEDPSFDAALAAGYRLEDDAPFSSFTGFRSSRRVEGYQNIAHAASRRDFAFTSSLTVGFSRLLLAKGVENLFGGNRPSANLWRKDKSEPYPTGQLSYPMVPRLMYSLSMEQVLWRPLRKVILQMRPEVNLGYYTNVGLGLDFGKVMSSNLLIDNLSYTDTHNPGLLSISDSDIALSIVGGATARAVLYNGHLNGLFRLNPDHYITFKDTRKIIFEGYVGVKLQFFRKIEVSFSLSQRSSEFRGGIEHNPIWGTLGMKYLIATPGEGCYD